MSTTARAWRCGFFGLAAVLAGACGAALSPYMRAYDEPEPMGAPPHKARVVVVRPSSGAYDTIFTLIDERGYFLGDSSAGKRFSVFFEPGEHYVIAMTDGAETLKATLAAGRTYYVELRPTLGVWTPRAPLLAVNRGSGLQSQIAAYLAHTRVTLSDFTAGQAHIGSLGSQAPDTARRGIEAYAGYSPEAKAAATLVPEDGQ